MRTDTIFSILEPASWVDAIVGASWADAIVGTIATGAVASIALLIQYFCNKNKVWSKFTGNILRSKDKVNLFNFDNNNMNERTIKSQKRALYGFPLMVSEIFSPTQIVSSSPPLYFERSLSKTIIKYLSDRENHFIGIFGKKGEGKSFVVNEVAKHCLNEFGYIAIQPLDDSSQLIELLEAKYSSNTPFDNLIIFIIKLLNAKYSSNTPFDNLIIFIDNIEDTISPKKYVQYLNGIKALVKDEKILGKTKINVVFTSCSDELVVDADEWFELTLTNEDEKKLLKTLVTDPPLITLPDNVDIHQVRDTIGSEQYAGRLKDFIPLLLKGYQEEEVKNEMGKDLKNYSEAEKTLLIVIALFGIADSPIPDRLVDVSNYDNEIISKFTGSGLLSDEIRIRSLYCAVFILHYYGINNTKIASEKILAFLEETLPRLDNAPDEKTLPCLDNALDREIIRKILQKLAKSRRLPQGHIDSAGIAKNIFSKYQDIINKAVCNLNSNDAVDKVLWAGTLSKIKAAKQDAQDILNSIHIDIKEISNERAFIKEISDDPKAFVALTSALLKMESSNPTNIKLLNIIRKNNLCEKALDKERAGTINKVQNRRLNEIVNSYLLNLFYLKVAHGEQRLNPNEVLLLEEAKFELDSANWVLCAKLRLKLSRSKPNTPNHEKYEKYRKCVDAFEKAIDSANGLNDKFLALYEYTDFRVKGFKKGVYRTSTDQDIIEELLGRAEEIIEKKRRISFSSHWRKHENNLTKLKKKFEKKLQ